MNYDFKSNWMTVISPLLELSIVKESIENGITDFINSGNAWSHKIKYDNTRCPASYGRSDWWHCHVLDDFRDKKSVELVEKGILLSYKDFCKKNNYDIEGDGYEDAYIQEYFDYKAEVFIPYIKEFERTDYRSHLVFSACHWWNPTFCLTLAKLIYPLEEWKVLNGMYHTTITNKDQSMIFDIIVYDEKDEFKGGKIAIEATKKTTMEFN
jgi:hypothetical protein